MGCCEVQTSDWTPSKGCQFLTQLIEMISIKLDDEQNAEMEKTATDLKVFRI